MVMSSVAGSAGFEPADRKRAETHYPPGVERIGHLHRLGVAVDLDSAVLHLGKGMAAIAEFPQERRLGSYDRGGARRVARFERQLLFVLGDRQRLSVKSHHLNRGDMVERTRLDRYRNLCRLGLGVDVVGEFRIPIAEAVRGIGEPAEIAIGAPAERLLGSRHFVLERLQLRDAVQEIGELAILGAGNLDTVIQIRVSSWSGDQRHNQRDRQQKPVKPHPAPKRKRRLNHVIPESAPHIRPAIRGGARHLPLRVQRCSR